MSNCRSLRNLAMVNDKNFYCIRIIDDEKEVSSALSFLLGCDGWICKTYSSAMEFLENDDFTKEGCVFSDIRMPEMSGLLLQTEMKKRNIKLPLVFISGHGDIEMAVEAIQKGAIDFLVKPIKQEKLFKALYTALENTQNVKSSQQLIAALDSLSDREKLVLKAILDELPTSRIAERLDISERTVQGHRWRIYQKIGVHTEDALRRTVRKEWVI